jgi:hypothetical protein
VCGASYDGVGVAACVGSAYEAAGRVAHALTEVPAGPRFGLNSAMAVTADGKKLVVDSRLNSAVYVYSLPDLTLQFKLSRAVDDALRRLAAARADLESRASKTAGPESETLRTRAAALQAAYAPLPALFDALQEADLRPNPAVEAAVTEALARVEKVLAPSLPGSHRP